MDADIAAEIANEMRAMAVAMFGLRRHEEVLEPEEPTPTLADVPSANLGLADVDVLGGSMADFDFDQDLGPDRKIEEDDEADVGAEPEQAAEPSRWATHDEPTIHAARTRAMLDEIAFLDE